jgi:hypothetical protein
MTSQLDEGYNADVGTANCDTPDGLYFCKNDKLLGVINDGCDALANSLDNRYFAFGNL